MRIEKPNLGEILEAKIRLENGDELTDREIWILSEFDDDSDESDYF